MKKTLLTLLAASFLFAACNNDKKTDEAKNDTKDEKTASTNTDMTMVDSATMMKNWQEYMAKSDVHKMMETWAGNWNSEITMWEKPGSAPQTTTGTTEIRSVLNGMYMESVDKSTMMGMPFEGHGTWAYDNAKKKMVATWIDNMGSGIMTMEGAWDSTTRSTNLTGRCYNPAMGKDCDMREVFKVVDDNTHMMEMYGPGPNGEFKMMEIKFTRKK